MQSSNTAVESSRPESAGAGRNETVLVCTARHPRARGGEDRFAGRIHGVRLQMVPFRARATYREVEDWSDLRPGCLVVRCSSSDCRAFSEYEIVGPVRTADGALLSSHSGSGARARSVSGAAASPSGATGREPRGRAHPSEASGLDHPSHLTSQ